MHFARPLSAATPFPTARYAFFAKARASIATIAACAFCVVAIATGPAAAEDTVIYRCTDASGAVTLQNGSACPKGSKQEIRRIPVLPSSATPPPATAPAVAPAPARPTPRPEDFVTVRGPQQAALERKPPPALFQCRTWDDRDYLGDTGEPPASCVPLQVMGIGGAAELGAGQACEMRRDACVAVPEAQLCAAWKRRVDEAEFRWKFGGGGSDERKAEYERLLAVYAQSSCFR
jgi:hypothetical protein